MTEKVSCTRWFGLALQALIVLAEQDGLVPSATLAERIGTRSTFLRKILTFLVKAELIQAKEGRDGGYSLTKDPAHITLAEVYFAMRSESFAKGFLDVSETECPASTSALCDLKNEMESWLIEGLGKKTIADLLTKQ